MKIVAVMPCYKVMDIPAVISLTAMMSDIYSRGDHFTIAFAHGYLTDQARQNLFKYAVQQEADYVLSLDSDHVYKAEHLYKLIKDLEDNNLDMLSAKYYVRDTVFTRPRPLAMCNRQEDKYIKIIPAEDEKGIQECDVVGFGFLVFKMGMVKGLMMKHSPLFKMSNYGEDAYFCEIAKREGYKVAYDADVIVGHLSLVNNK